MLQKISGENNAITWFEIPVADTNRAKKFYETILDMEELKTQRFDESNEELTFFPFKEGVVRATSGKVSGVLLKSPHVKPSADGTTIYLNASPAIQPVLDRVEKAGGKILQPVTKIPAGLIAIIIDTEGNRIGLHAES